MPPRVIIADADHWSGELLAQLVRSIRQDVQLAVLRDSHSALEHCRQALPDLLIADHDLPGGGLSLLREVRRLRRRPLLPFILISAKIDAHSVREAMPLAPTAYLAKPFNIDDLLQRLRQILPSEDGSPPAAPAIQQSLDDYLIQQRQASAGAPLLQAVQETLQLCLENKDKDYDLGELEQLFRKDPQLTAQLIAAANSAAQHCGNNCQTLAQALPRLGLQHSLNMALGLTLQRSVSLGDPLLAPFGQHIWQQSQCTAALAHCLALRLKADAERCYTAGLLHLLGDLAVLRSIQGWRDLGGAELSEAQVNAALKHHAAPYGSALRTRWRLPLELRQLIAACFQLGSGVHSREALILHVARQVTGLAEGQDLRSLANSKAAHMLGLDANLLAALPQLVAEA
ncbi:MAG TPA: HDOD domain-containing protein [Pseudomonas sp.]|nr:HDOD domain-containing protein [Pseudomonas sp.]